MSEDQSKAEGFLASAIAEAMKPEVAEEKFEEKPKKAKAAKAPKASKEISKDVPPKLWKQF